MFEDEEDNSYEDYDWDLLAAEELAMLDEEEDMRYQDLYDQFSYIADHGE